MYFHIPRVELRVGSIVIPGNWGHHVRQFVCNGPAPVLEHLPGFYYEFALEAARKAFAFDAVSRLNCVFVFEQFEQAQGYRSRFAEGLPIFRCIPLVADHRKHRASIDILSRGNRSGPMIDYITDDAIRYWTESSTGLTETLIDCGVTLTEKFN